MNQHDPENHGYHVTRKEANRLIKEGFEEIPQFIAHLMSIRNKEAPDGDDLFNRLLKMLGSYTHHLDRQTEKTITLDEIRKDLKQMLFQFSVINHKPKKVKL